MKLEYFIAKRLISRRNVSTPEGGKGVRTVIKIAVLGIALGIMIMIASMAIVRGFQSEIRAKVIGFGSHIQVTAFNPLATNFSRPVDKNQPFVESLAKEPGVKNIQVFGYKEGIIKTEEELQGIIVKGIDKDFNWAFFSQNLVEGSAFTINDSSRSDSIIISRTLSKRLMLELGDKVIVYFIQNEQSRPRRFYISGIYDTGLEQFDKTYVIADIKHIQNLNDWSGNMVTGFEVILEDYNDLDKMDTYIYRHIGEELTTVKITDLNRDIFGWLELQDINVVIIISLIILVSGINMTSALLIMILERTGFIGIMKAMGAANWTVRKIFLLNAGYLIAVGLFWGNLIGVGFCLLQDKFKFLTLPQESYYMSYVPIQFEWMTILWLNIGTLILCTLMLILPSYIITKISPIKAIKFT